MILPVGQLQTWDIEFHQYRIERDGAGFRAIVIVDPGVGRHTEFRFNKLWCGESAAENTVLNTVGEWF